MAGRYRKVVSARFAGKAATLLLYVGIVSLIAGLEAGRLVVYAGAVASFVAGFQYIWIAARA